MAVKAAARRQFGLDRERYRQAASPGRAAALSSSAWPAPQPTLEASDYSAAQKAGAATVALSPVPVKKIPQSTGKASTAAKPSKTVKKSVSSQKVKSAKKAGAVRQSAPAGLTAAEPVPLKAPFPAMASSPFARKGRINQPRPRA